MVRNFLSGLALGGVVAGVGLGVASQMVPLDPSKIAEIMVAGDSLPSVTPPEPVVEDKSAADAASVDAKGAAGTVSPSPDLPPAENKAEDAHDVLLTPVPDPTSETATVAPMPETLVTEMPETEEPAGGVAKTPEPEGSVAKAPVTAEPLGTTPDPASEVTDTIPKIEPSPVVVGKADNANPPSETAVPADPAAQVSETTTEPSTLPAADPLQPVGSLVDQKVADVTTERLPRIGAEPIVEELEVPLGALSADPSLPPVKRFAQDFQNPGAKPLFAVLLIDPGNGDVNRAELAALPFPVTFVIDPMADNAAEVAKAYRDAGQEVVMLANGIPKGAKASDLEQSFAKLTETLPEAVALIDTADATFQDNRGLAGEVVTLLAAQGRGVITFDRGLNAADQVARREGVPSATIFRSLDDDGEDAPLIRRYLDRAAFKAAQEGQVVVIGTARPETIAALMEWAVEGRAASVALAPITAVMATK